MRIRKKNIVSVLKVLIRGSDLFWSRFLEVLLGALNTKSRSFFTFSMRPKVPAADFLQSPFSFSKAKVGIVIQGPLKTEDDYTLETVRLYRRLYPDAFICLSTWEGESEKILKEIASFRVVVVRNIKPEVSGYMNLNFQIVSTLAGLQRAQEEKCDYVLKTRTDQRMYNSAAVGLMLGMVEAFPVSAGVTNQSRRILGVGSNTYMYRPFSFADVLQFGAATDLLNFWSGPLDSRRISRDEHLKNYAKNLSVRQFVELEYPEVFLFKRYLQKCGAFQEFSLKNYFSALRERFIVLDSESIDLQWGKYSERENFNVYRQSERKLKMLSFADWVSLTQSDSFDEGLESLLDERA